MANTAEDLQSQRHLAQVCLDRLALTPIDDEAVTADDRTVIETGVRSLEKNGGSSTEEVLDDLGLTLAEFEKLPDSPLA